MRKTYLLEDLDCANCAAKMEKAISKLPGVSFCAVSFIAQKLVIEAEDRVFSDIMDKVIREIQRVEPDCRVIL